MSVDHTFTPPEDAPLDPGSSKKRSPKVLMAEFGNGYIQRAADGPNSDPLTRQFSWTNLTEDEKDSIDQFFTDRKGWQAFYYQKHDDPAPLVYICTEWEVVDVAFDVYTVTATFKQVYDI